MESREEGRFGGGISYQFVSDLGDDVRVVHSSAIIGPNGSDVHARFVVPIGKEVIEFVVGHWSHGNRCTLPGATIRSHCF